LIWWIQIKDYVENALKQLSIGTFFSDTSHSEQTADNNVSARLAAQLTGFTLQNHSAACVPCGDLQQYASSPLCLEERGLFFYYFYIFHFLQYLSYDDCLEDEEEDYCNCYGMCCIVYHNCSYCVSFLTVHILSYG